MRKQIWRAAASAAAIAASAIIPLASLADLPSGYRQLDYVDTDGSQWVNTLFRPTCTNAVEIKASVVNPNSTQFLYCTRRTTSNRMYSLCITGGKTRFDYQAKNADASYSLTGGVPYVFFASPSEDADQEGVDELSKKWTLTCTVDGNSAGHVAGAYFTTDTKAYFCLFGAYASGGSSSAASLTDDTTVSYKAKCRFYYFKVWDTKDKGNLLCHIIPAYGESEAAVGLYDLVAERFLPVHGNPFTGAYALTADEDWSDSAAMQDNGITVDLNGQNLTMAPVVLNSVSAFAGEGYQDLAYIKTTGKQALRITGFRLPGSAKVEMKLRIRPNNTYQALFMSRSGSLVNTYTSVIYSGSGSKAGCVRFDFNNSTIDGTTALSAEDDHVLVFNGSKTSWTVDGIAQSAPSGSNDFTSGGDLCILTMSTNGLSYAASCRLYYYTVTTNGTAILDLHPVRRMSDGAIGLYDTVGNGFYESFVAATFPDYATPKFTNSGETASELVVGEEVMPGYTVVDCITATTAAPHIDTGYVPAATDRLEMKASLSLVSGSKALFCSREGNLMNTFTAVYSGGMRFDFNNVAWTSDFTPTANESFTVALDGNAGACYVNGALCDMGATTFNNGFTPSVPLLLFALYDRNGTGSATTHSAGSIYWFKATGADGKLKVDMVPVVRNSDNAAGLYDRVRRAFYPSSVTTAFTAGTQVGDGRLYVDVDGAFAGTEVTGNVTLVKKGEGAFDGGGLSLASTLRPEAGTIGGVTLSDGATLDLSDRTSAFSLDDNAISFANGACITVALGLREVRSGTKLISWTTAPANVGTLSFRHGETGRKLLVKDDGVYLMPKGLLIVIR